MQIEEKPNQFLKTIAIVSLLFLFNLNSVAQNVNVNWFKSLAGESTINSFDLHVDPFGNSYLTGDYYGVQDFDPGPGIVNLSSQGDRDIFIVKLNGNGDFEWAKSIGGMGIDQGFVIESDSFGSIYLAGVFRDSVSMDFGTASTTYYAVGQEDAFLLKLSDSGDYEWFAQFGGFASEFFDEIDFDIDQNIYLSGSFSGQIDTDPGVNTNFISSAGYWDGLIIKLTNNGDHIWSRRVGGAQFDYCDRVIYSGNAIYAIGTFQDSIDFNPGTGVDFKVTDGIRSIFVMKLDTSGNFSYVQQIGNESFLKLKDATIDKKGNILITGVFEDSIDFDPSTIDQKRFSGGDYDVFILQLDSQSNFNWVNSYPSLGFDEAENVIVDTFQNVFISGAFGETIDFGSIGSPAVYYSPFYRDIYFLKLNKNGSLIWSEVWGTEKWAHPDNLEISSTGEIYCTGWYDDSITVHGNSIYPNLDRGLFVLKLDQAFTSLPDKLENNMLQIYPNPTNANTVISCKAQNIQEVLVFDQAGKIVKSFDLENQNNAEIHLDFSFDPAGFYFIKVISKTAVFSSTLVKY